MPENTPAPDDTTDGDATQDNPSGSTDDTAQDTGQSDTDLAAEVEKWKALARKHEDRAKANATAATELTKLRTASMSEQEKAVEEARTAALAEARTTFGSRLVDAEVRAAAAGRDLDTDALLDGLDRSRFLTQDGEPDTEALRSWIDRLAPQTRKQADLGQGRRGNPSPKSKADVLGDFLDAHF